MSDNDDMISYLLIFSIIVVSLLIVGSHFPSHLIFAQVTTSTYVTPTLGLKLEYPSEWELQENPIGVSMTPEEGSIFSIDVYSLDGLPSQTLKDFARYQYTQVHNLVVDMSEETKEQITPEEVADEDVNTEDEGDAAIQPT